jgi:hypothetical protein
MSWDAVLLRIRGKLRPVEDVDEADYLSLGKRKDVLAAIKSAFPAAKRSGSTRLLYLDGDLSIDFTPIGGDTVDSVLLEVRGEGDPITPLVDLAGRNGWVLLDASTSEFIDPAAPSGEGYEGYRGLVTGKRRRKKPS